MGIEDALLRVPTELGDAGPHVRLVAGNIMEQLRSLKTKLGPLEETWTGAAFELFHPLELQWQAAARGLFGDDHTEPGVLGDVAHRLDEIYANYMLTQHVNTRQWMH